MQVVEEIHIIKQKLDKAAAEGWIPMAFVTGALEDFGVSLGVAVESKMTASCKGCCAC